jgi:membrane protein implicated in regulation of membrane protease activity
MLSAWHIWTIIALILFILEIFTPGFVLASFGIGCIFSALAALVGLGLKLQIVGFMVGTLAAFFGARPLFTKYCYKASCGAKTNVEALIGKKGRVTEEINQVSGSGRVLVGGDDWKAVSVAGDVISKGTAVEVVRVEGITVLVRPAQS